MLRKDNIFWQRRLNLKISVSLGIGIRVIRRRGGGKENLFCCLHSQSWAYYIRVVSGLAILEDGIKKENNIRIKMNKVFSDTKYFKTKIFVSKIFFSTIFLIKDEERKHP